ncbi:hypothetical protein KUTeg_012477 [Tegillarca granosa]|uniref:Uncharacterized protein n=1 Tax=Tegillarca granosa TaxID=220873 RepID=A0ABQ9EZM3_TEGGR|nr:hypothetical protein KUTeg_012477 [Tegillarca granosa]
MSEENLRMERLEKFVMLASNYVNCGAKKAYSKNRLKRTKFIEVFLYFMDPMAESPGDTKSATSRTSINVKLPSAGSDDARRKAGTPTRQQTADFAATLEGQEIGQPRQLATTTPVSSRASDILRRSRSPGRLLRQPARSEKELIKHAAATIIERAWIAFRDKQMFRLLKHAVCAAENSLTQEILRKVCPKEAELLSDKSMQASEDSLRLMGNRQFYDQMLQDAIFQQQYKITDEIDVTTLKDYMQYLANIDESPATHGGKENYWRKLTLDDLPRRTIFYDVVDYLYNQRMTPALQEQIPILVQRPVSQEKSNFTWWSFAHTKVKDGPRLDSREPTALSEEPNEYFEKYDIAGEEGEDGEEWEQEANKLYEWTQELSFNDELIATPRLPIQT